MAYYFGWMLPPGVGIDYPTYYHAARFAFLERRSPYGPAFAGIPGFHTEVVQPYLSLPPSLLIFWPLAKLSPANAQLLFVSVSLLCYAGSIWLILFKLTPANRDGRLRDFALVFSLTFMLSFDPAFSTLGTGDASFITLFLICLTLAAIRSGSSSWRIALPLTIAILLKSYPALLLIPLLARKQYRAIAWTSLFLIISAVGAKQVLPPHTWRSWYTDFLPVTGYINTRLPLAIAWNQSLNAFVMRLLQENYFSRAPLFHPLLTKPVIVGTVIAIVGVTSFCSFRLARTQRSEASNDYEMSAYVLLMFLIAPIAWDHHLVYVLPAATVVISLIFSEEISQNTAAILVAALLVMAWQLPLGSKDITEGWLTLLISAKLYPVLILWLFFVRRLYRAGSAARKDLPVNTPHASPA